MYWDGACKIDIWFCSGLYIRCFTSSTLTIIKEDTTPVDSEWTIQKWMGLRGCSFRLRTFICIHRVVSSRLFCTLALVKHFNAQSIPKHVQRTWKYFDFILSPMLTFVKLELKWALEQFHLFGWNTKSKFWGLNGHTKSLFFSIPILIVRTQTTD